MTMPLQRWFNIHRLGHNMINLSTKFEVSMFTHYKDTKDNIKCRKWDGLGRLGVIIGHQQPNHSIECIRIPIRR